MHPLFVCSIGNTGTYAHTLHSAGHMVLGALVEILHLARLEKSRTYGHAYMATSTSQGITLWESPTNMNTSGPVLIKAWQTFQREVPATPPPRLIVLHDEMEAPLGEVCVRTGGSVKGHNGLKSVLGSIRSSGALNPAWWRIGIGIGRPKRRDRDIVSAHVLRKGTPDEIRDIRAASSRVYELLTKIKLGEDATTPTLIRSASKGQPR